MKRALTIILAIAMLAFVAACGEDIYSEEPVNEETTPAATTPAVVIPDYEIAQTDDISIGATKRYSYRVVIAPDVTEEQVEAVAQEVIEKAKSDHDFNAVSVFFFGKASEIEGAYTVGMVEYAPGGDWSAADAVDAGDYDSMELVIDFGSPFE